MERAYRDDDMGLQMDDRWKWRCKRIVKSNLISLRASFAMFKKIHVAAENPNYRESLRYTIESYKIGDVVVASSEGSIGTVAVRESDPDILIVSTEIGEDTVEHMEWYRAAAPRAHIIGFAFTEEEARGMKDAGIQTVVSSTISRNQMIQTLQDVDKATD